EEGLFKGGTGIQTGGPCGGARVSRLLLIAHVFSQSPTSAEVTPAAFAGADFDWRRCARHMSSYALSEPRPRGALGCDMGGHALPGRRGQAPSLSRQTLARVLPDLTSGAKADGRFGKQDFVYQPETDTYRCPAGEQLIWHFTTVENGLTLSRYWSSNCGT